MLYQFSLFEFISGHGDVPDESATTVHYVHADTPDDVISSFGGGTSYMYADVFDLIEIDCLPDGAVVTI